MIAGVPFFGRVYDIPSVTSNATISKDQSVVKFGM